MIDNMDSSRIETDIGQMRTLNAGNSEHTDRPSRFVRITNENHRGFVEFQFSIGDPELYIEMVLPSQAFAAFCKEHEVQYLDEDAARAVDAHENKWRYGNECEE